MSSVEIITKKSTRNRYTIYSTDIEKSIIKGNSKNLIILISSNKN